MSRLGHYDDYHTKLDQHTPRSLELTSRSLELSSRSAVSLGHYDNHYMTDIQRQNEELRAQIAAYTEEVGMIAYTF